MTELYDSISIRDDVFRLGLLLSLEGSGKLIVDLSHDSIFTPGFKK